MREKIFKNIKEKGWAEVNNVKSKDDFLLLAKELGRIIPHPNGEIVFSLIANNGEESIKGTLSSQYGFGSFPLHTDTAFWARPARYVLLNSINKSESDSLLFDSQQFINDLSESEHHNAIRATYLIKTNRNQLYTSLIFTDNCTVGFKFDPTCMYPVNRAAHIVNERLKGFLKDKDIYRHRWKGESAIVIDNWRILHGRSSVSESEKRLINRIYLGSI